jgi:hypothetical protein
MDSTTKSGLKKVKSYRMHSSLVALQDISDWINEQNIEVMDGYSDVWVVTPFRMYNREQRRLNAELGISSINYIGNANGKGNRKLKIK